MSTVTAAGPRSSRSRRLVVGLLCAFLLPLALTVSTAIAPAPAQAASVIDIVKVGAQGVRNAPYKNILSNGGRMIPHVRTGMMLLTAFQLGTSALDMWQAGQEPSPDMGGGAPSTSQPPPAGQLDCGTSITPTHPTVNSISMVVRSAACAVSGAQTGRQIGEIRNVTCKYADPAANPQQTIGSGGQVYGSSQGAVPAQFTFSWTPCPSGSAVNGYEARGGRLYGTGESFTPWFFYPGTQAVPAPQWTSTTTVTCRNEAGATQTISSTLNGEPGTVSAPSCFDVLGPGWIPERVILKGGPKGGAQTTLLDESSTAHQEYPGCWVSGQWSCRVKVYNEGVPCVAGGGGLCANFWPERDDSRLSCRLASSGASYVVAWSNCSLLKEVYKRPPGTQDAVTIPGTGLDPVTTPGTGTPTEPNPTTGPSTGPTTGTNPTTGPNPTTDPLVPGPQTPANGSGCWGDNWSWNPVSWVFTPVKCALMWAFVPETAFSVRVGRIKTAFADVPPFSWFGIFPTIPEVSGGGNCPNWRIKVGDALDKNVVCGNSYTNAIVAARPWIAGGMLLLAFWPLLRGLMFASVPILKPTPTDGGGR